jgi:HD superfamily phosphodiesterase
MSARMITLGLVLLTATPAAAGDGYTTGRDYADQAERDYRRMEQDAQMDRMRRQQENAADDQAQANREILRRQEQILDELARQRRNR